MSRLFFPVGGAGGGPTDKPFDNELWHEIITHAPRSTDITHVGLLATPAKFSDSIDATKLLNNHKILEKDLNCSFTLLDEDKFAMGHYDGHFDILCITCGNTQGARDHWKKNNSEEKIRSYYQEGVLITGYSAGFILFYEWGSTDSVPAPHGATYGVMPCMGIIKGGAVPHIDTQQSRIADFQNALKEKDISPVMALGENTMAIYKNESLKTIKSSRKDAVAGWVNRDNFLKIPVEKL